MGDKNNQNTINKNKENDFYDPWSLIHLYFNDDPLNRCVQHQLESYNNFINNQISETLEMFNPINISSINDYNNEHKKHKLSIKINLDKLYLYRPEIHENNGATKIMFPQEARLRNFTYNSTMTIDLNIEITQYLDKEMKKKEVKKKVLNKIHIGKMPIMIKSDLCVLKQYNHLNSKITGECSFDAGGYFIINGSEKVVIPQERAAENNIQIFKIKKKNKKFQYKAEIKCIPDNVCISPKQINILISNKNNGYGFPIYIQLPKIKQPIPVVILFRALNIISDKDICSIITLNNNEKTNTKILHYLKASIIEYGIRNSLLLAPMPTASTSQILGNNECFEPFTSNIYSRNTIAGDFIIVNKHLQKELIELDLWNNDLKNNIILNRGSIQQIDGIPDNIKEKYKIVWEIPMKHVIEMSTDRGAFICQSQSLNLWQEDPTYGSLTSMHFYAWKAGLKTGMYYLRRKAKHQAQQFTIEPSKQQECETCSA